MYKGAQASRDFIARTGSHATKGHGSKGADLDGFKFLEQVRSDRSLLLSDKKQRRAELIALTGKFPNGIAHVQLTRRIAALNVAIKEENRTINDNYSVGIIYKAMGELLPAEMVRQISERAMELRMLNEQAVNA
jgi:hypothetical protein